MNKQDLQHHIRINETLDTDAANLWIEQQGLNRHTFSSTNHRLLQAQIQAHVLLTRHRDLLSYSQRSTLEDFQQLMAHPKTRKRLKPTAAQPILNISSKINRQLFKQHRQLNKA
jgi:hypothetical protein